MPYCEKHRQNPLSGYNDCASCEIEMLREENYRMKQALGTVKDFTQIRNDLDMYLFELVGWALSNGKGRKPQIEDFGV